MTPVELRGTAFGLRQAMDTVGAFVGPLLAMFFMAATNDNFRLVFWIAVAPAIVSVLLILYGVQETDRPAKTERRPFPVQASEMRRLDLAYWSLVGIATIFTLGWFSEAFLLLAAEHVGLAVALIPGVLVTMNIVYAASAYPFGRLSDKVSRRVLLALGIIWLMAADVMLAMAGKPWQVFAGVTLWGLHMGTTQGLLSALVVDSAPRDLRGTALGIYNLTTGIALLAASILAGWLWTGFGPAATFITGPVRRNRRARYALVAPKSDHIRSPVRWVGQTHSSSRCQFSLQNAPMLL